jgi:subtilisin family serine protease
MRWAALATALSAALALSVTSAWPAQAAPPGNPPPGDATTAAQATAGPPSSDITLVTGDVVEVTGTGSAQSARVVSDVAPFGDVHFLHAGGDLYALPGVAAPALASGQLDPRLFDLSLLIRDGYTDEKTSQTPVIVSYTSGGAAQASRPLTGATVERQLPSLHGLSARVDHSQAKAFFDSVTVARPATPGARAQASTPLAVAPGIRKVWLDGKVKVADDVSRATIGTDQAWAAGDDGTGQTVAVVDTGIDASHPDLAGQVVAAQDFVPAGNPGSDSTTDRYGHGTHVASIIAGTGAASGGKYAGVAPKAKLVNAKVLTDNTGAGADSWIIAGMQWAATKARVINMSLGGCCTDGSDPITQALDQISAGTGALFVVAAGNSGPCSLCVGYPGMADAALSVAATTRDGTSIARYSSRGPRAGDYALKPEIAAPGSNIIAAAAPGSLLAKLLDPNGTGYMPLSGTSMATPHVAASAALVLERHPDWTAQQVKDDLTSTARPVPGALTSAQGAGLVNVGRAVTGTVDATGVLNLGDAAYPQAQGDDLSGTITYTNSGTSAATLDLTDQFWTESNGANQAWTSPAGAVTIEPAQVVVPAGGTATATVRVDAGQAPVGTVYGSVSAEAGGAAQAATTLDFTRDVARFPLTVTATDVDGQPPLPGYTFLQATGSSGTWINYPDQGQWYSGKWLSVNTGDVVTGLPAGTYQVTGEMGGLGHDTLIGGYTVTLDHATAFPIDGRQAHPIGVATPRPTVNDYTVFVGNTPSGDESGTGITTGQFPGFTEYLLLGSDPQSFTMGMVTHRTPVPLVLRSLSGTPMQVDALLSRANHPGARAHNVLRYCLSCARLLPASGRMTLVDAGDGSPAALAGLDLHGKVALIRQGPGTDAVHETFIDDEIAAAAQAGAVGVVLAADAGAPAPIRYADSNEPIWSTVITQSDGARLAAAIESGPREFQATADRSYDYQLDLPLGPPPADGAWRLGPTDLATVQMRYHAPKPATGPLDSASWEAQDTFFPVDYGTQTITGVPLPSARTEYVNANTAHLLFLNSGAILSPTGGWDWVERLQPMAANQVLPLDVNVGPMAPGRIGNNPLVTVGPVFLGKVRVSLGGSPVWPTFDVGRVLSSADGNGGLPIATFGALPPGTTVRTRVDSNGTQVCDVPQLLSGCTLQQDPTATVSYRIQADTTQPELPNSTRTSTEWTVNVGPSSTNPPLVLAESKMPVDLSNLASGGNQVVPIHIAYQPGGPPAPSSWTVKVWATLDDGATWAPVYDGHAGPDGQIAPRIVSGDGGNGYVGLRIQADDGHGNSVDQTVIRAYTLRAG